MNNKHKVSINKTDKIISEYKEKSDQIIRRMFQVLVKAQKKVDDESYKRVSEELKVTKKK